MDLDALTTNYRLTDALLRYRLVNDTPVSPSGRIDLATEYWQIHRVEMGPDQTPILLEGRPLTDTALHTLCHEMAAGLIHPSGFLDGTILAYNPKPPGSVVWWVPPTIRSIFFDPALELPSGRASWPGLVLAAHGKSLRVYALATSVRPRPETPLYRVPLPNIDHEHQVCLGNADKPRQTRPKDTSTWERAFFDSRFTNHHTAEAQAACAKGAWKALWKSLIKSPDTPFPVHLLRPHAQRWTLLNLLRFTDSTG